MFDEILVCLDGSAIAEKILPLAQEIASRKGAKVILLRVVADSKELLTEESYMRQRASLFHVPFRFLIAPDPAVAIIEELTKNPRATAALTTHGRTAWKEALLGSVALPTKGAQAVRAALPLGDVLESSYLQGKAAEIKKKYEIEPSWDVLHGEAGDAICRYVNGMQDTALAMTSHARGGLERVVFGSVAATCIRHAGVPILIYWPDQQISK